LPAPILWGLEKSTLLNIGDKLNLAMTGLILVSARIPKGTVEVKTNVATPSMSIRVFP
jgi:hypothetical protein